MPLEENVDPAEFRRVLEHSTGEREVAAYLKTNPWIAYWTLCPLSGHDRYQFAEFPLGSRFCVDLVVLNAYSGTWKSLFVELEPVDDPVFNADGTPTRRLATAIRQIDDWRGFVEQNQDSVRRDLVRWAKERDSLGYSSKSEPFNYSGDYLANPTTHIHFEFKILIGRSSVLSQNVRYLMGRHIKNHDVELVSYDRLLDLAERRYRSGGLASDSHAV